MPPDCDFLGLITPRVGRFIVFAPISLASSNEYVNLTKTLSTTQAPISINQTFSKQIIYVTKTLSTLQEMIASTCTSICLAFLSKCNL
jgi:hypothetical protein